MRLHVKTVARNQFPAETGLLFCTVLFYGWLDIENGQQFSELYGYYLGRKGDEEGTGYPTSKVKAYDRGSLNALQCNGSI